MAKKIIIALILIIFIGINTINARKTPHYYIFENSQEKMQSDFDIYDFDFELYKYNTVEIYAVNSSDFSREDIASIHLKPKFHINKFNIFDLSSLYFKHKGTISLAVQLEDSSVCASITGSEIGSCTDDKFMVDLNDYYINPCMKEGQDSVTVLHMDSKTDDNYIEVIMQFYK